MEERSSGKLRLFIGIPLSEEVRAKVLETVDVLKGRLPGVRWVPPENLHISLKFIGFCDPGLVPRAMDAMKPAAEGLPVRLELGGVGGFPSSGCARVVWVGALDRSGALEGTKLLLDRMLSRYGVRREKRAFRPHVTIGRVKGRPVEIPVVQGMAERTRIVLDAGEIVLFNSELRRDGARYTVLGRAVAGPDGVELKG